MATQRRPVSRSPHMDLAERVLSAAAGMHAGLASEGPLPSRRDVRILVEELLEVLFPESHRMGESGGDLRDHVAATIEGLDQHLTRAIYLVLHRRCAEPVEKGQREARAIARR